MRDRVAAHPRGYCQIRPQGSSEAPEHPSMSFCLEEELSTGERHHVPYIKLTRSRRTHEGGERARFNVPIDVVQEASGATRDRDVVVDLFPGEGFAMCWQDAVPTVRHERTRSDAELNDEA
jgi:hypothetical protein